MISARSAGTLANEVAILVADELEDDPGVEVANGPPVDFVTKGSAVVAANVVGAVEAVVEFEKDGADVGAEEFPVGVVLPYRVALPIFVPLFTNGSRGVKL